MIYKAQSQLITGVKRTDQQLWHFLSNIDSFLSSTQNQTPTAPAVIGSKLITCTQGQIAGLLLGLSNAGTVVAVTDFQHFLFWNGSQFSWLDEGSNWYCYSDSVPNGTCFKACAGQTVQYLNVNGSISNKTLPNVVGGAYFLELGTGTGSFVAGTSGTVSGTCAVTVVGTCSVTVSGSCDVSVTGTCDVTSISGTDELVDIPVSGSTRALDDQPVVFTETTLTLSDATGSLSVSGIGSVSDITVSLSSVGVDFSGAEVTGLVVGDTELATTGIGFDLEASYLDLGVDTAEGGTLVIQSEGFSIGGSVFDSGHFHFVGLDLSDGVVSGGSGSLTGSPTVSGSVPVTGSTSGSLSVSGSIAIEAHVNIPILTVIGFANGSGTVSGTGTGTISGSGSGSVSASGGGSVIASGSGTITGTAVGVQPTAWLMQAFFRI